MRPSTNWKDENIIDLTAEALGTLDEREQFEAPPKDLVRIRQAVQSETSYPGQPDAAPPGRTETGPGRLTFQRRAQVPAGEEERRAGHERGDHVYEKMSQKGELPTWLKTLAAAPSKETRASIDEVRARPPPIDPEFRPPNFDPLSPNVVAPDHWRKNRNERSRHDQERDQESYFAAEANPPRRVRIFDDELPLAEHFRAEIDDPHRSPSTSRRHEKRDRHSSRKRERERGKHHRENRSGRREQHGGRKHLRSHRVQRARSRSCESSGSSNDERHDREGNGWFLPNETARIGRQPGVLASGAAVVSNNRSGDPPAFGLVQDLEHMAELRYSPFTSQTSPRIIPFGTPIPPLHTYAQGQQGHLRTVPFSAPSLVLPPEVGPPAPLILPFSQAAPHHPRSLGAGATPVSTVAARTIPFLAPIASTQQVSPANVAHFRFAPHHVGQQVQPTTRQPVGPVISQTLPPQQYTGRITAPAAPSGASPRPTQGFSGIGSALTHNLERTDPMPFPQAPIDARRQQEMPTQIQNTIQDQNRDQKHPVQKQAQPQPYSGQFRLPHITYAVQQNDARPLVIVNAKPTTLPSTSAAAGFSTGASSPYSNSISAVVAATSGRLPLASQAVVQQHQQARPPVNEPQTGSDGIFGSAQESAKAGEALTYASVSGSSVSAPRTPGHVNASRPAPPAHGMVASRFKTPARVSTRLPGRLSLPSLGSSKLAAAASADEINTSIIVDSSQAKKLQQQLNKMSANRSALGKSASHTGVGFAQATVGGAAENRTWNKTRQPELPSSGSSHRFSDGVELRAGGP